MIKRFQLFIGGLSTNWLGKAGVVLTTSAFLLFVVMELLRVLGMVTNSYVGLVTYMTLPALFLLGLILIPLGWARYRRVTGMSTRELLDARFTPELTRPRASGSRLLAIISTLTLANVLFLGIGGTRMLHFMDEPEFCGTACHSVMHPEWATYQDSPHAHVKCVECHVGEGAGALVDAKLNGLWQVVSASLDLYERPIPTPVRQLRPARETCEKCHWPDQFYGDRIKVIPHYLQDSTSTPTYTTLALKVGSGTGERRGEIHWHIAEDNEVRYASVDDEREEMLWVEARRPDGSYRRFVNRTLAGHDDGGDDASPEEDKKSGTIRTMDCVDCHNRATHVYEDPERAVDDRIAAGLMDRSVPFLKRQALTALTGNYASTEAAMTGIRNNLEGYYARFHRAETMSQQEAIDEAVEVVQTAYRRNIHPLMKVTWGAYPDHRGHRNNGGCFRCHNSDMVDTEGRAVPYDCTLCHSILSYDSPEPFQFLLPIAEKDPQRKMHRYLQTEFLQSRN